MLLAVRNLRRACLGAVLAGLVSVPASAAPQHATTKPDPGKPAPHASEKPAQPTAKRSAEEAAAGLARIEAMLTPGAVSQTSNRSAKTTKPATDPRAPSAEQDSRPAAKAGTPSDKDRPAAAATVPTRREKTKGTEPGSPTSAREVVRRIESLMADAAKARGTPAVAAGAATASSRRPTSGVATKPKPLLSWESPTSASGAVLLWENDIAPIGRASKRKGVSLMWPDIPAPDPLK